MLPKRVSVVKIMFGRKILTLVFAELNIEMCQNYGKKKVVLAEEPSQGRGCESRYHSTCLTIDLDQK